MSEIRSLKPAHIVAYEEAKKIIEADLDTKENMSTETKKELINVVKNLVEYSVVSLMNTNDISDLFWAHVFLLMNRRYDFTLPAPAAVTINSREGILLLVNPYSIIYRTKTFDEFTAIIKHEGHHILYNHLATYKDVVKDENSRMIVNIATDCEINQHISGLPEWTVSLKSTSKLAKKELKSKQGSLYYYDEIMQAIKNQSSEDDSDSQSGNSGSGQGNGSDNENNNSNGKGESNNDQENNLDKDDGINRDGSNDNRHTSWVESEVSKNLAKQLGKELLNGAKSGMDADSNSKNRGSLPSNILEALDKLNVPGQIKWSNMLRRMLAFVPYGDKYSKNRLYRRDMDLIYRKGRIDGNGINVVAFIDTSGSMSTKELKVAINECVQITKQKKLQLYVGQLDTEIQDFKKIKSAKDVSWEVKGRGGTYMQPAFDYLKDNNFNPKTQVIFFTDGYIESSIENYDYENILWVLTEEDRGQISESIPGNRAQLKINL